MHTQVLSYGGLNPLDYAYDFIDLCVSIFNCSINSLKNLMFQQPFTSKVSA